MSAWRAIAANEWRTAFASPLGWTLVAGSSALCAWLLLAGLDAWSAEATKLAARADAPGLTQLVVAPYHATLALWLVVLVPVATMRTLCGERRAGTLALLYAAGAGDAELVLGKFAGAYAVVLAMLAPPLAFPLVLAFGADLDQGLVGAGTLMCLLVALLLTAIGLLCSAFAQHPATAALGAIGLGALLCLVDGAARARGELHGVVNWIALPTHVAPFLRGIVGSVDVVYFLALSAAALALAARRSLRLRERG